LARLGPAPRAAAYRGVVLASRIAVVPFGSQTPPLHLFMGAQSFWPVQLVPHAAPLHA